MAYSVGSGTSLLTGTGEPPKAPKLQPYTPTTYTSTPYDEDKIRLLTQEESAGAVRGLRSAIQRIAGESVNDPTRRMTLRQALAGYGEGMQNAMSSASRSARNAYNTEYNIKENANRMNFANAESARQTNYNAESTRQYADYNALLTKYYKSLDAATKTSAETPTGMRYAGTYTRTETPSIYTDKTGPNAPW